MIPGITGRLEDYMRRRWTDQLQITARLVMRELLKILWVFPVNKRKILFESFNGASYSCNPKYLSEYLELHCPGEYELIWSLSHPESFPELSERPGVHVVRKRSLRWYYDYLTAGVHITNFSNKLIFFPKRKNQFFINTWHGGGAYKRIGILGGQVEKEDRFQRWRQLAQAGLFDLFLSSCSAFTDTNIRSAHGYAGNVLNSGIPRNDLFLYAERVRLCSEKVRSRLGVSGLLILYAPTYRGKFHHAAELPPPPFIEIADGARNRYGCEPTILMRTHYADPCRFKATAGAESGLNILDISDYPDMQELLCAADILITDYSSSIWDYAQLGRPCLLYVPDLEEYQTKDSGFFTPIEEWPGIICRDRTELYTALCRLDEKACQEKAEKHLKKLGSYECGHACKMTEKAIRHFIETGSTD